MRYLSKNKTRVLLVHPWNYHDEGIKVYNPATSWRNGPFNIVLLATILRSMGVDARILDLEPILIANKGDVSRTVKYAEDYLGKFKPDIVGITFFSVHYIEVKQLLLSLRNKNDIVGNKDCIFVAGGIHATISPESCVGDLGFDYAFMGEGEIGLVDLAMGRSPCLINGLVSKTTLMLKASTRGDQIRELDSLPFADWSLCDYKFYSYPSSARLGFEKVGSIDLEMGRGCVYKCTFCAYNALSSVRFHSAEYLVEQMLFNIKNFGINGFYFTDSTIGNNRKVVREMCEIIIRKGLERKIIWLANIRSNQVNEEQLKLMWSAGCRFLLYGFESNSQRILDAMEKKCTVEANEKAAILHSKLGFPYNASMLLGFPGETEDDINASIDFVTRHKPPSIGINWYVPLPGSPDYDDLMSKGLLRIDGPEIWRRLGEVNDAICYADIEESKFRSLYAEACDLAYSKIPSEVWSIWAEKYRQKTNTQGSFAPISLFKNVYSHVRSKYTFS